jgi:hypothetical protein
MTARLSLFACLGLIAALACTAGVAQQPVIPVPTPPAVPDFPSVEPFALQAQPAHNFVQSGDGRMLWDAFPGQDQSAPAKLAKQYVKAEKEDEKKEIRKKLTDYLTKQFDSHADLQQKELKQLEKQIEDLRTTLKKRQDAKNSIVERRVDQLIYDAQGMGWSNPATPRGGPGSGYTTVVPPSAKKL